MNGDDERDYAEEAANQAAAEQEFAKEAAAELAADELWRLSPLLVEAAAITGSPYKCPSCGVFALAGDGCTYCGWPGDRESGDVRPLKDRG